MPTPEEEVPAASPVAVADTGATSATSANAAETPDAPAAETSDAPAAETPDAPAAETSDMNPGAPGDADAEADTDVPRRGWVSALPGLAWLVGLTGAGVLLYLGYLQVSRTQAVTSDGASNALQAWAMLHGNPLLRGWTVTDVSFYTTELPEYMLVEAVRGLHADVLHVSAAITYTLVVLTGGLLARGRATGREGIVRMLIAAGIMVAPQLGPGAFILIFQPDHIGTQVPLILTFLVLDRAPRRSSEDTAAGAPARAWFIPVLVCAMLTWVEVADRLAVLIGAAPLAVVCAVRAYQHVVQRRERILAAWFDVSLVLAAGLSVELSSFVVKRIGEAGGFTVLPVESGLAPISEMGSHAWLAVESVFGLYGADFFGMSTAGLNAGIAFLHVIGLALAGWGLWLVLRRFFGCGDRVAQVLALGILVNMAAYLLSTTPTTYWSARELAGVLPFGAVLAGRMLGAKFRAARLAPAGAVVLACYLAALGYTATQPSVPAISQNLANWLVANHLRYGLSSYGIANTTTLASGGAVSVRSISWYNNDAAAGPYEYDTAWYDPQQHDANFVVLMNPAVPRDPIPDWEVYDAFGHPAHVYQFADYVIMTYNTNLLTDLSPSLPNTPGAS